MAAPEVSVARARVRDPSGASATRRSRMRSALSRADLAPVGLSRGAVLIVRQLQVTLNDRVLAPWADTGTRAWETEARGKLTRAAGAAARPALQPVTNDRSAVLFADRSELVACLLCDTARGVASDRWWWQGVLASLPSGDLAGIMLHEAQVLPGALDLLADWGEAAGVVGTLRGDEASDVLGALCRRFSLPTLPRHLVAGSQRRAQAPARISGADDAEGGATTAEPKRGGNTAPWAGHLGPDSVPGSLGPEQAVLLATGLLLARHARVVRTPAFRAVLERPWTTAGPQGPALAGPVATGDAPSGRSGAASPDDPDGHGASVGSDAVDHRAAGASGATEPTPVTPPGPPAGEERTAGSSNGQTGGSPSRGGSGAGALPDDDGSRPRSSAGGARNGASAGAAVERPQGGDQSMRSPAAPMSPATDAVTGAPRADEGGVRTGLAGVWYLVNLLPALIGRSTAPDGVAAAPDELTGWALLEVLSRGLLDPGVAGIADDPVWALLADCDGRAVETPMLPPGPAAAAWWAEQGPGIARWIRGLLGGGDPAALLHADGRLVLTRTHLDVLLPLTAVSMRVRIAGLDRDPGWVPLLGRVVAFHFLEEVRV